MLRVLVIFAEIEYDQEPGADPQPDGAEHWPKGELPRWADELFDHQRSERPAGHITRYYHDMSLGNFILLGDHLAHMVTIKQSEVRNLNSAVGLSSAVVAQADRSGKFRTAHDLSVADFDHWKDNGRAGLAKEEGPDTPHSYDHLMVILRNSMLKHGSGSTDPGSPGELFGHESDTQSRFGAMWGIPRDILLHEFNHMLFGGNNFHSMGGNAQRFQRYFIGMQGGWGMMGGAFSSLLTANAWDRDRLGWRPVGAIHRIRVHDPEGNEVNGDLDVLAGDTGRFVLRDFVTSGDALRIRLPFIPEDEFPQWIWLENHQTEARNGCPDDVFHFEVDFPCVVDAVPGIYAYLQVDRGNKTGRDIYGGQSDFLRPLVASGHTDLHIDVEREHQCILPGTGVALSRSRNDCNPLTGWQDQEMPRFDQDGDGQLSTKESLMLDVEMRDGVMHDHAHFFGHARHAFTLQGNALLGMGTDPSTASQMTLVCSDRDVFHRRRPNNRVVRPNGISVELLEQRLNGDIVVRVRRGDVRLEQDIRWCADSIVLNDLQGPDGHSLVVAKGKRLLLDRSGTPTRIDSPDTVDGITYWSDPTRLTLAPGVKMRLEDRAVLELRAGSELHLMPGSV
ncbi:MAG: hypothetical protein KDC03_23865, partial [Flavobacteriales bacterium]|nr:hypothetical protein [Flavobacteriales bacterium]